MLDPRATQPDMGSDAARLVQSLQDGRAQTGGDLKRAAQAFEAYFIGYLLQTMRSTVPKGLLPNQGGEFFTSFYDQELGRLAAEAGGLGLAHVLQEHLSGLDTRLPLKKGLKAYAHSSDTDFDVPQSPHDLGVGGGREE